MQIELFYFSLSTTYTFLFFLTTLTRTSSIMLNKNGESEYSCLILNLLGKKFSFTISVNLAVDFFVDVFIKLSAFPLFLKC